jgi:hypothetical protein
MQAQRTTDGARVPQSPDSTPVTSPAVPARSARRATARRASNRRATARQRKDDVEGRIVAFLEDHPRSTTGDIAKALNASRATIGAERLHMARTSGVQEAWPSIIAMLDDGPLRGTRIETPVVEGRPPSTVDAPADDGTTCRYCLAEWTQTGPSAKYTFLYRV